MTFNPRMVTLARESSGVTQTALAHQVGVSQATMSKIEAGLDEPSGELLEKLARECEVPVEFFTQSDSVLGEGIVEFFHRRRRTLPAKPLNRAHARANIIRLELLRLLRGIEFQDVAPLPTVPAGEEWTPTEAAALTRAGWRVPPGPLPDLVGLVESSGIPVVTISLGHEKLRAISMPGPLGGHLVLLNSDLSASSQRFSLAHELGHLTMHYSAAPMDIEEQADSYASALLAPAADIQRDLEGLRFANLGSLKHKWRMSMQALVRAARDTGAISDRQYRTLHVRLNQLPGGLKHEPGEFPPETPRLIKEVMNHYLLGLGYSVEELSRLIVASEARVRQFYLGEPLRTIRPVGRQLGVVRLAE